MEGVGSVSHGSEVELALSADDGHLDDALRECQRLTGAAERARRHADGECLVRNVKDLVVAAAHLLRLALDEVPREWPHLLFPPE